ncbi:MAG TPA: nucleotidyltransferase family protein [Candidatus Limnocylindrales bacterium]|nr:nucleotidyltransferase family protein [Candidatus Limnocylindrales bacterium]
MAPAARGAPAERPSAVGRVAGVVLAAGEGRRFGGGKLLAPVEGGPMVQRAIDAANASACDPVVLVVGHQADVLLGSVRLGRARPARNAAYAAGLSGSLRVGLDAAGDADAAVVVLADQPGVTAALLDALIERQRHTRAAAVICSWRGRRSPPTLLTAALWPAIRALEGDVGAREVLAGRDDVAVLEVVPSLARLDDVDTPEDHARLAGGRPEAG